MISKNKKFVIGALHFMPLKDYQGYTDYRTIQEKAKADLKAFENGGVDFVIIENNYNLPHRIKETKEVVEMMCQLAKDSREYFKCAFGRKLIVERF